MDLIKWISKLFSSPKSFKIFDPDRLLSRTGNVRSKNFNKYHKKYTRNELNHYIQGKKVKLWKCIYSDEDEASQDLFIPIFYKHKR